MNTAPCPPGTFLPGENEPPRTDWYITLAPKDSRCPWPGGVLEIVSAFDMEDVQEAFDGWLETFQRRGFIPDNGGDFRSTSPIAVVRRYGRLSALCRADCYEFETDAGYSNGFCWLGARIAGSSLAG